MWRRLLLLLAAAVAAHGKNPPPGGLRDALWPLNDLDDDLHANLCDILSAYELESTAGGVRPLVNWGCKRAG